MATKVPLAASPRVAAASSPAPGKPIASRHPAAGAPDRADDRFVVMHAGAHEVGATADRDLAAIEEARRFGRVLRDEADRAGKAADTGRVGETEGAHQQGRGHVVRGENVEE